MLQAHPPTLAETGWYSTLCAAFTQRGLDGASLLEDAGLPPDAEADQDLGMLCDGLALSWELARQRSRNPAVGLRAQHPLAQLQVLSHLLLAAATLREALKQAERFLPLFWPMASMASSEEGDAVSVTLALANGRRDMPPEVFDFFLIMVLDAMQRISAGPPATLAVYRPGPAPDDPAPWQQAFGCPVHFGATSCRVELAAGYVARPVPTANPDVYGMAERLTEELAEQRGLSFASRIRAMLPEYMARGEVRRATVAQSMGISERTLCRRLGAEGTNFAEVVDDLRRDVAERYFIQGNANPTQIAYSLGFSDPSNFYRACKRWFGNTPRVMRNLS